MKSGPLGRPFLWLFVDNTPKQLQNLFVGNGKILNIKWVTLGKAHLSLTKARPP